MHHEFSAITANKLRPGMAILHGCYCDIIENVTPSATGKTVKVTYIEGGTKKRVTRRYATGTEIFIDGEIINYLVSDRANGLSAVTSSGDDSARHTYDYYVKYLGTEYTRVTWERSVNGGNTYEIIERTAA